MHDFGLPSEPMVTSDLLGEPADEELLMARDPLAAGHRADGSWGASSTTRRRNTLLLQPRRGGPIPRDIRSGEALSVDRSGCPPTGDSTD